MKKKKLTKKQCEIVDNLDRFLNTSQFIYRLGALSAVKLLDDSKSPPKKRELIDFEMELIIGELKSRGVDENFLFEENSSV